MVGSVYRSLIGKLRREKGLVFCPGDGWLYFVDHCEVIDLLLIIPPLPVLMVDQRFTSGGTSSA